MAQARDSEKQLSFSWRALDLSQQRRDMAEGGVNGTIDYVKRGLISANDIAPPGWASTRRVYPGRRPGRFLNQWSQFLSTLCVDPMLTIIPDRYLPDGK